MLKVEVSRISSEIDDINQAMQAARGADKAKLKSELKDSNEELTEAQRWENKEGWLDVVEKRLKETYE